MPRPGDATDLAHASRAQHIPTNGSPLGATAWLSRPHGPGRDTGMQQGGFADAALEPAAQQDAVQRKSAQGRQLMREASRACTDAYSRDTARGIAMPPTVHPGPPGSGCLPGFIAPPLAVAAPQPVPSPNSPTR